MRIRNRLYFSAAISIVMVIILGVVIVLSSNQAARKAEIQNAAHAMSVTMSELNIVTYEYLLHREKRMGQQWNSIYSSTVEILEKTAEEEVALTKSILADYAFLGSLFSQVTTNYKERQELIQEGASQKKIDATLLLEERLVAQLQIKAASIITDAAKLERGTVVDLLAAQELIRKLTLILMIVLVIIVTTTSLLVARSISKPLAEMIKSTGIIGKGNLEHKVEVKSKDELGSLATAFNKMTKDLIEIISSRDDLSNEITARKKAEEELTKHREHLEELVKKRTAELEEKNKELKENTAKLEKSQQSLALLLKDVNESRDELDKSNKKLEEKTKTLEKSRKSLALLLDDVNESRAELDIANKKLEASNKELEAFSYSVSHDLRAPLRAIGGFTNILMEDYVANLDDEGKRLGRIIQQNAQKMGNLIDDLLAFSRMGRVAMSFSKIDMQNMAKAIYHEATNAEERKRVKFIIGDLLKAKGDTNMMRQVWMNLISNALKFSAHRKQAIISITCKEEENKLIYCIKDNGAGFNMKYKDKLFGVFQRLHSEKEFSGTGVGLALVQRIIRRHEGEVWAEGEVDNGATFYFSLLKK